MDKPTTGSKPPKPDPDFLTPERSALVDRIAAKSKPLKVTAKPI